MEEKEVITEGEKVEERFSIIDFFNLSKDEYEEDNVAQKIEDKLGISLKQIKEVLSKSVIERSEELSLNMINIAPNGDYEKLLEDNDSMSDFLKKEASKLEHWKLDYIFVSDINNELLSFVFSNDAVDDGTTFEGFVFITKTGKIKHSFAQVKD